MSIIAQFFNATFTKTHLIQQPFLLTSKQVKYDNLYNYKIDTKNFMLDELLKIV